ncbi:hypothetical protein HaLaN_23905, partial [Haematococcus lacustris]
MQGWHRQLAATRAGRRGAPMQLRYTPCQASRQPLSLATGKVRSDCLGPSLPLWLPTPTPAGPMPYLIHRGPWCQIRQLDHAGNATQAQGQLRPL